MIRTLIAAALALLPSIAVAEAPLAERIVGRWASLSCELRPQANPADPAGAPTPSYLTRAFTYGDDGTFTGRIVVFADAACSMPLVAYDFAGDVVWHGPNPAAPGALSNDYVLNAKLVLEPLSQPFADGLNALPEGACGTGIYEVGVAKDILGQACVLLNDLPEGAFVTDHDLLYMHPGVDGMLFMGAKHVDGTGFYAPEHRPVVGLQQPMIRVE